MNPTWVSINPTWVLVGINLIMLVAGAGGFVLLTKNHLHHIQMSLDRMERWQENHGERIATLEGRLNA